MAIRTIDAPGIEIHEIDKSQYSPAMTGTKVLVTGFANSGEDYIPMIFTSKSAWLNYYGEPDNEAERYFYAASMEVLNQNGVVNCCKLPYENEARDKFVGFKYKLNTVEVGQISTVSELLDSEKYSQLKDALPNSEVFNRDVLKYFLANCNVTDATDKLSVTNEIQLQTTSLSVLDEYVNTESRSDGRTDVDGKNFYGCYGEKEGLGDSVSLSDSFLKTMTKSQLVSYVTDLSGQSTGVIPRLNAFYFINTTRTDAPSSDSQPSASVEFHQDISVVIECDAQAHYAILTAVNDFISTDVSSAFLVNDIKDLIVSDPDTPLTAWDDVFAMFEASRDDVLKREYFNNNGLSVRFTNGVDAFQLRVGGSNVADSCIPYCDQYEFILDLIKNHDFILQKGSTLEEATEYFDEIAQNT